MRIAREMDSFDDAMRPACPRSEYLCLVISSNAPVFLHAKFADAASMSGYIL